MLDLTETATSVIRSIAERPDLPDDAGLRVAVGGESTHRLTVAAADGPEEGDHVVEKEGARVFLDHQAAEILDDKLLDARVAEEGGVEFLLSGQ